MRFAALLVASFAACAQAPRWEALDVTTEGPCLEGAMVWEPLLEAFVLHGGRDRDWADREETWILAPGTAWRPLVTELGPGAGPGVRAMCAMVWDPKRELLILFGGRRGEDEFLNDLWALEGGWWVQLEVQGAPPPRSQHGLVHEPALDVLVLFGGRDARLEPLDDTWILDLTTMRWEQCLEGPSPAARDHVQLARDPLTGTIVLRGCAEMGAEDETWHFDPRARRWEPIDVRVQPIGMDHGFLQPVEALGGLVLFGYEGEQARTWLYRPSERRWTRLRPRGTPPSFPIDHGLAASDGECLFVLGGFANDADELRPAGDFWRLATGR